MNRTSLSVALVCGLGAFIGYVTAAQLAYWLHFYPFVAGIVGMIMGGTVGYCTIDFERFCSGVGSAYNSTINWKPYKPYWKTLLLNTLMFSMLLTYLFGGALVIDYIREAKMMGLASYFRASLIFLFCIVSIFSLLVGLIVTGRTRAHWRSKNKKRVILKSLLEDQKTSWRILVWGNPIGITVKVVLAILWFCLFILRNLHSVIRVTSLTVLMAARLLGSFAKQAFILVHSDRRLICFVDAALGTAVGWFAFHNAFAGAVAGAILGFVNYEIISIRMLKLAPAK